jgi:hypothetical protein
MARASAFTKVLSKRASMAGTPSLRAKNTNLRPPRLRTVKGTLIVTTASWRGRAPLMPPSERVRSRRPVPRPAAKTLHPQVKFQPVRGHVDAGD